MRAGRSIATSTGGFNASWHRNAAGVNVSLVHFRNRSFASCTFLASCAGVTFETYVDWLLIVAVATLCACPALSIPCGFTAKGLPVGLQVIAPNRSEARLLSHAKWMEDALGLGALTPIDPRSAKP